MHKLPLVLAYNAHARHCFFSYAPARGSFGGFPRLYLESVLDVEKWMSSHMRINCAGCLCIQGLILLLLLVCSFPKLHTSNDFVL
jgi:hypothetical protein